MNKENLKVNCKVAMRKIKQQWGEFSEDQISQIQRSLEDQEWKAHKRQHFQLLQKHTKELMN